MVEYLTDRGFKMDIIFLRRIGEYFYYSVNGHLAWVVGDYQYTHQQLLKLFKKQGLK